MAPPDKSEANRSGAARVFAGILLSRILGFVRESVFAHYFGNSDAADAFKAALRIPNLLQNLLGEGVLSASFIPVFAKLRAQGDELAARQTACAIATLLGITCAVLSLLGMMFSAEIVSFITPGFDGEKRRLATGLVQIFFPATALLVLSAWCLGVLNSHRRFFLSYSAPVLWNVAIIGALVCFVTGRSDRDAVTNVAWGLAIGSLLQLAVQLPAVLQLLRGFAFTLGRGSAHVLTVVKNFLPVVLGRGVVQISAFVDSMIASLLPSGAVSSLAYASTIYLVPVSLFGMSVSAAELPEMSSALGAPEEVQTKLRERLGRALRQVLFFVVPSAVAFLLLGDVIVSALYERGRFTTEDTRIVWYALIALSIGLPASTIGRLYASTYYALHDTTTPFRVAVFRVLVSGVLGALLALYVPGKIGLPAESGIVCLCAASALGGWCEQLLLSRTLRGRIGDFESPAGFGARLMLAALASALLVWGAGTLLAGGHIVRAVILLPLYGGVYLGLCAAAGVAECQALFRRLTC